MPVTERRIHAMSQKAKVLCHHLCMMMRPVLLTATLRVALLDEFDLCLRERLWLHAYRWVTTIKSRDLFAREARSFHEAVRRAHIHSTLNSMMTYFEYLPPLSKLKA